MFVVAQKTAPHPHPITPKPGVLGAPVRAARPNSWRRKQHLLEVTIKLNHYPSPGANHHTVCARASPGTIDRIMRVRTVRLGRT